MKANLDQLVKEAVSGNNSALKQVIKHIKDFVYNLSLKMLFFPEDAKDASQEILVRVVTRLSTYRGDSKFETWVYRVATNYLITEKNKTRAKALSFEEYAALIDSGQSETVSWARNNGELSLLEEEVKVSCTHGLLHCLNPSNRLVYILGEILEFNSMEGAEILQITPANFRKKLSRSRKSIRGFLMTKCGLINARNSCRCKNKIDFLVGEKMIDPEDLQFAHHTQRSIDLVNKMDLLDKTLAVFRSVPVIEAPQSILVEIRKTINSINI